MISKHIKHHLTEAGKTYFTQIWLPKLKAARAETKGFIDILVGQELSHPAEVTHLTLLFQDQQGYDNWGANPVHIELLAELKPYLTQASEIALFQSESVVNN